jgi:hypothetical protein
VVHQFAPGVEHEWPVQVAVELVEQRVALVQQVAAQVVALVPVVATA